MGVTERGKFYASINVVAAYLGAFDSAVEAAVAYAKFAAENTTSIRTS